MQVTSMLSAGYLEPMQNISRVQKAENVKEVDQANQQREQEILAEEQAIKAKLGSNAQVHTVYHYSVGSDGRRYIVGASVTMKGSEEDLNRVSGGIAQEDLQSQKQEAQDALKKDAQRTEDSQNIIKAEAEKREAKLKEDKAEDKKDDQERELEDIQREVVAHEAAHQAAAGEFGGGVSYSYTEVDGKAYITGGEVPIKLKEGGTPEETLRNMQQVQRAANAPADPSGQDRAVAAKAAAIASKARQQIIQENSQETHETEIARGTPIITPVSREDEQYDSDKDGVQSLLASIKELEIQNLMPAA